jgi:hypothetical protein
VERTYTMDIATTLTLDDFRSDTDPAAIGTVGYREPID